MKKVIILLVCLLMITAIAAAQNNSTPNNTPQKRIQGQPAIVILDTENKTGFLVYKEYYYVKNETGGLVVDNNRTFFRGNINISNITLRIIRPLDKNGKPYDEGMVKAVATLDNETILNSWYKSKAQNVTIGNVSKKPAGKKESPGFELGIFSIAIFCFAILAQKRCGRN